MGTWSREKTPNWWGRMSISNLNYLGAAALHPENQSVSINIPAILQILHPYTTCCGTNGIVCVWYAEEVLHSLSSLWPHPGDGWCCRKV